MTSDSEDETMDMLREAVDTQFLNDDMYKQDITKKTEPEVTKLPSLRRNIIDEDESYNFFKVSPDFQKYVSKHLSKILEEKLQNMLVEKVAPEIKKKKSKGGVKLLSTSTTYLKLKKDSCNEVTPKKPATEDNTVEDHMRCAEVAVSSEDVLNGKDMKFWKSNHKSALFLYKKDKDGFCKQDKIVYDFY